MLLHANIDSKRQRINLSSRKKLELKVAKTKLYKWLKLKNIILLIETTESKIKTHCSELALGCTWCTSIVAVLDLILDQTHSLW